MLMAGHSTGGWSGGGRNEGEVSDDLGSSVIDTYYFYYDVSISGTYYFKFYNILLDKYTIASIDVDINQFLEDNVDKIDNFTDKMVVWSRTHFGFLSYPFELVITIFNKVTNINFEEPIITIPELNDPTTGITFFNGTSYNFKSAVNINSTTKMIYDIYLVVVDVILIFLFVNLCKKVFEEVFK